MAVFIRDLPKVSSTSTSFDFDSLSHSKSLFCQSSSDLIRQTGQSGDDQLDRRSAARKNLPNQLLELELIKQITRLV